MEGQGHSNMTKVPSHAFSFFAMYFGVIFNPETLSFKFLNLLNLVFIVLQFAFKEFIVSFIRHLEAKI